MKSNAPANTRFNRLHYPLMLLFLLFLLLLPGCKRGTPEVKSTDAPGLPAGNILAAETAKPVVLTASAPVGKKPPKSARTPAAKAVPSPTAGKGTPGACRFPSGWVVYTILPGDTLIRLSLSIGVSVEEIQRGNCMESTLLVAYETIHLPRRPPVHAAVNTATAVIAATGAHVVTAETEAPVDDVVTESPVDRAVTEVPCASIFTCGNSDMPSFTFGTAGQGQTSDGKPRSSPERITRIPDACDDGESGPRIHTYEWMEGDLISKSSYWRLPYDRGGKLQIWTGSAHFFFACGFDHPENIKKAWVTGPVGTEDLAVQGSADQRGAAWYPCGQPEGSYTVNLSDRDHNQQGSVTFELKKIPYGTIMVKPVAVKAGTKLDIYYCGYSQKANTTIPIGLYGFTKIDSTLYSIMVTYDHIKSFDVPINEEGWYLQKQTIPAGTPANLYVLKIEEPFVGGLIDFWVDP